MDQHPIPQQISSYEFRLVGDMTLKQFAQVAGGCLIGLVFYASPLPWYLKWPAILIFVSLGVGLAFFPVEERPLQTWIVAFLRAIYSPTQYIWQKRAKKPEVFEEKTALAPKMPPPAIPGDQKKLAEYLATLPANQNPLDQKEANLLEQVRGLFALTAPAQTAPPSTPTPQPKPTALPPIGHLVIEEVNHYTPSLPTSSPWQTTKEVKEAQFASGMPFPYPSERPNILVGLVKDTQGRLLEGAVLEIRDSHGHPVRALRTNKLGQFRTATPLNNDIYEIETEKPGLGFEIVRLELKGGTLPPIEIRAKGGEILSTKS